MSGFGYNVLGFGANASSAAAGGASDDEFNRVSFLSHFEGSNNGVNNAFDDGSASNHTITANGNVTQGSFGPFARPDGEWGCEFSANGDTLNLGSSTDFDFAGDFSIEMFLMDSATDGVVFANHKQGVNTGYYFFNRPARLALHNEGDGFNLGNDNIQPVGVWYHLVISRQSGSMRVFIDGVLKAVVSNSSAITSSIHDFMIGGTTNSSGNLDFTCNAKVSNFRIVNGSCATAYQTSSTTIGATIFTVPTGALTAETNTKLLTCQSNRFVDNSASAHTATPTGNAAVTAFGPFLSSAVYDPAVNGASAYFDGDNDSLSTGDSADFVLGDTFTLEAWVYPTAADVNSYPQIMSQAEGYPTGWYFSLRSTNEVNFYLNAADNAGGAIDLNTDGSDPVQLNAWNHVALSVSSGTGYIYVNGARKSSAATGINNNLDRSGTTFRVGVHNAAGAYDFDGYICDARVVKGTAVYSGTTYTIPTAPLTAITNTKLLLNMADGQAIDSAAQNNLTLFGTAKTSTGQAKFGGASLLLDGNSDYAKTSGYVGSILGGKTIECWVYAASISSKMCIWEWYEDDNNLLRLFFEGGNGNVLRLDQQNGGSTIVGTTGATTLSATTWYHLAVTRTAAGAWKVYINGTADTDLSGSESGTTLDITDIPLYLGIDFWNTDRYWNGYIDEFRVSELDRYASGNFTAPTAAFPDKGQ